MADRSDEASLDLLPLGLSGKASAARAHRSLRWVVLGGCLLLAALGAYWIFVPHVSYTTEPTRFGDLRVTVMATGPLEPTEQVQVGSELSGTLESVDVGFNARVHAGQVLARLDTSRLEAQTLQSRAALEAAQATLDEARASQAEADDQLARLRKVEKISGGKVPSPLELASAEGAARRARAAVHSAQASVAEAKATLDVQKTDLGKAAIRSPIDGVVLSVAARPGQTVAASLQAPVLFTLAGDLDRLELDLSVDEADVGKVKEGQKVLFSVDAWPDKQFTGRVEQVHEGAQVQGGVVSYETVVSVDNPDLLLRPGMTATAEIQVRQDDHVLLAPNAALRFDPPQQESSAHGLAALFPSKHRFDLSPAAATAPHVWVLRKGSLERVAVEPGASDGSWTEIRGPGLSPGMDLAVDLKSSGG